jgi:hypothetical protein
MSNIQSFYSQAQAADFARLFQFQLVKFGNLNLTNELIYVETASLPGRQINNIPVPYMGLAFNVPGTASYPGSAGYNVTFRCDQAYNIRDILEQSLFNTFSDADSTGNYSTPAVGSDIILQLLDKQNNPTREYTLFGAYVQALADTAYDIKDNGTVATVQATIAYQFWRLTNQTNNGDAGNLGTSGSFPAVPSVVTQQ